MAQANPNANSHAGYHQFSGQRGSFEVFWDDTDAINGSGPRNFDGEGNPVEPGWYWWPCFPGCLPDCDAMGPYASSRAAFLSAMEG